MDTADLKTINYRGGVVRFRIPADWQEEYEDAGGGTFYGGDDTGTLRINVLTVESPADKPVSARAANEVLESESLKYGVPIMPLRDGVAMIRFDLPADERGQSLTIRYWRVAQSLPPKHVRLVLFSYTMLAEQVATSFVQRKLELIDREIAAVQLASVLGQRPPANKPWWRFW